MKLTQQITIGIAVVTTVTFIGLSGFPAFAAGEHKGSHAKMQKFGMPGKADKVTRTIKITMLDNEYEPKHISVKAGETVRFLIHNAGEFVHEFAIATKEMHEAHRPEMAKMMELGILEADKINLEMAKKMQASMGHGMHAEPNSELLEPGKSGEIVWTFPKTGKFEFACNVPGHYETGMVGMFNITN